MPSLNSVAQSVASLLAACFLDLDRLLLGWRSFAILFTFKWPCLATLNVLFESLFMPISSPALWNMLLILSISCFDIVFACFRTPSLSLPRVSRNKPWVNSFFTSSRGITSPLKILFPLITSGVFISVSLCRSFTPCFTSAEFRSTTSPLYSCRRS